MPDLLDVNVWLPLSVPDHAHHPRTLRYWEEEAAEEVLFCRVTALAFLRCLTNSRILGEAALDGASAWRALKAWLSVPGVGFLSEPPGVDEVLAGWAGYFDLRGGHWTDAYLAALALAGGCRLVTFDAGFSRYPGVELLLLRP